MQEDKVVCKCDLTDQSNLGPHPILYCLDCYGEYSANKADYFMMSDDDPFMCCNVPMILVTKTTMYRSVG